MDGKDAAKELYGQISNFVNGYRHYSKQVAEELTHDHRLLQAYVVGLIVDMVDAMAKQDNNSVTMQNKAAVELCRTIKEAIGEYPQYL